MGDHDDKKLDPRSMATMEHPTLRRREANEWWDSAVRTVGKEKVDSNKRSHLVREAIDDIHRIVCEQVQNPVWVTNLVEEALVMCLLRLSRYKSEQPFAEWIRSITKEVVATGLQRDVNATVQR